MSDHSLKSPLDEEKGEKSSQQPTDTRLVAASTSSLEAMAASEGIKPIFLAKVTVMNAAIQDCGMGPYQWKLFISSGFGWFADNVWLQSIAILMPAIANQDGWPKYSGPNGTVRLATLALYAGLIVGAMFWGMTCDVIGRRAAWNLTLVIGGVFGIAMLFLSAIRVFVLPMDESPKFLVSIGRDRDAVEVVHRIAKANGTVSTLTVEDLHEAAKPYFREAGDGDQAVTKFSTWGLVKNSLSDMDGEHLKGLFATPRLAYSTSLIIFIYGALGLAYPLFNAFLGSYLTARNAQNGDTSIDATYSAYTYQASCGVIGSFLAAGLVQWSRGGRKFAMAFFTVISGLFLFGLTAVKTSRGVNALTCLAALFENAFYGVLYGYAPEVFPTPHRGTGDALAAAASRVTGLFSPIIAVYSNASKTPNGPVYASAAIFVLTGLTMLGLPIETVGVAAH
ncbi:hypothetical protein RQP46_009383 [Phenoliferia psychrophenolica]